MTPPAAWLDTILYCSPTAICVMDRELRFVRANSAYAASTAGLPEGELLGMTLVELMGAEFEPVQAVLRDVITTGNSGGGRFSAPGTDGQMRTWQYTSHGLRDEHGSVAHVVSFVSEITAQLAQEHQHANELRTAVEELACNRLQLEEAQALARVGSWEADMTTWQSSWSREARRMHEIAPDEHASFEAFLSRVHPDDRDYVYKCAMAPLETREAIEFEYRILLPSGSTRRVFSRNRPVVDDAGRVVRLIGISQDVTEQRELEQRLVIQDRMSALGCLAAGLAHEINNPLSFVLGNAELALEETALLRSSLESMPLAARYKTAVIDKVDALRDLIGETREGGARVRAIVRDMKTFARGDDADRRVPIDLNKVVESTANLAANEIRHRAQFRRALGEVPLVLGTESRLGEVVLNLLVNATQAIPEGDPSAHEIKLATYTDAAGNAVIEVSDTGCGIPRENVNRIFDPFFTTKPIGSGTGLGLSICHSIIKANGGLIRVHSEVRRGTTFEIVLPPTSQLPAIAQLAPAAAPKRRARILVIDDEPMILAFARRCLRGEHDFLALPSAAAALERLDAGESFDVIVCDLMMPGVTGMDFFQQLHEKHPSYAQRIIFMTGGAFTARAQAFLDSVDNVRLEKPFEPMMLRDAVRECINSATARSKRASAQLHLVS